MNKLTDASQKLEALVDLLRTAGNFDLNAQVYHTDFGHTEHGHGDSSHGDSSHGDSSHGDSGRSSERRPELVVELAGSDSMLFAGRNGELLHALEHLAAKMLRLDPGEHDRISFDAVNFKANRDLELTRLANEAILVVRSSHRPFTFPPMTSRERRILHLVLAPSGMESASTGDGFKRSVVLYPFGTHAPAHPLKHRPRPSVQVSHSSKSG